MDAVVLCHEICIEYTVLMLGYRLDNPGFEFGQEPEIFLFSKMSRSAQGLTPVHLGYMLHGMYRVLMITIQVK